MNRLEQGAIRAITSTTARTSNTVPLSYPTTIHARVSITKYESIYPSNYHNRV